MHGISGPVKVRALARYAPRRGATSLIEILVVIAIIAVLFGLLLPSMRRSMTLASRTICMHNLREIEISLRMYRHDHDGWLPVVAAPPVEEMASTNGLPDVWFLKLYPTYFEDLALLTCPEDPYRFRLLKARDQLDSPLVADYASYGINSFIMQGGRGQLANVDRFEPSRPGATILVADLGPDHSPSASRPGAPVGPRRNESLLAWGDGFDVLTGSGESWVTGRHGDGINILTLAGGVRSARTVETMKRRLSTSYDDCARGGCTLCRELVLLHYSFADNRLYWWTGPLPEFASTRIGS